MQLPDNDIHIWSTSLALSNEQEQSFALLLSPDELERAARLRFPEHKRRFIISRSVLRQILSIYLEINPSEIAFNYGEYGKPALALPSSIQFNLSHSDDFAAYAIAHQPVGIDVEKIKSSYEAGLPDRFFSVLERERLSHVSQAERVLAFYRLWARKETIIKASGKGLTTSLASFSVSPDNINEKIQLGSEEWYLQALALDPAFSAALASQHQPKKLSYYNFTDYLITI